MLKRNVAHLAKLLDKKKRGWAKLVDTKKLNMIDLYDCVLGQVFGSYSKGFSDLMLDPKRGNIQGFVNPDARPFWLLEIATRLKKKK